MNIGIIHSFVGGGGGTEKTLHGIIDALEQTEHNVTLYTFSKPKIISKKISRKFTWGAGCGITGCVIKPHFKKKIKYQVEIKNKFGDIICFNHNYLERKDKFYLGRCQH